tara:strand:+ start:29148 stop:30056 length:909 start_codon:yes stop_codon:yes gene_type:complete
LGPTACGKTELAVELARRRNCELLSVDSAVVYRGMDIGSAKPDYPHHLVDIRDPAETYSAADFAVDARRVAAEVCARGATPLLVGGSMLYFRAFLYGLAAMPPANAGVRAEIAALAQQHGWPHVHAELAKVDPETAGRIHPNHSQRLSRALEVYRVSGTPLSAWHRDRAADYDPFSEYQVVQLALWPADRAALHRRIENRFQAMLHAGLLDEVRGLWRRGDLHGELPALRAVGYRQLWAHLEGRCSLEDACANAIAATRQLAKRQLTWLRKWPDLQQIPVESEGNGHHRVKAACNYIDLATT